MPTFIIPIHFIQFPLCGKQRFIFPNNFYLIIQMQETTQVSPNNKSKIIVGVLLLIYQIAICVVLSTVYGFNLAAFSSITDYGGMLLIGGLTILLIIGFGLINAYISQSALSGLLTTLLIYCLTIQHFYFFRAFWNDAGANDQFFNEKLFDQHYTKVAMSNYLTDRQTSIQLNSAPWIQGIGCALALNVAIGPVLGRIGLLEVFFLTLFGTFFYEVNAQLLWRWFVTDNGFGYRIFLFGAIVGIISTFLLGRKQTTVQHKYYSSGYANMTLGLLGFVIIWSSFPFLLVTGIYTHSTPDNFILYAAPVNMWLALVSGILGTFTAAAINSRKFSLHDLVFTGLTGGIIFSSSADVSWNPCAPLIVGFVTAFVCSFKASTLHRKSNLNGIAFSQAHISRYLIPGIVAAILVGVLQATGTNRNGHYNNNYFVNQGIRADRSYVGQGAFQILGIVTTVAIAGLAGVIIGILYKVINKNEEDDQFNDEVLVQDTPQS